jgi:hypothetical protein
MTEAASSKGLPKLCASHSFVLASVISRLGTGIPPASGVTVASAPSSTRHHQGPPPWPPKPAQLVMTRTRL